MAAKMYSLRRSSRICCEGEPHEETVSLQEIVLVSSMPVPSSIGDREVRTLLSVAGVLLATGPQ